MLLPPQGEECTIPIIRNCWKPGKTGSRPVLFLLSFLRRTLFQQVFNLLRQAFHIGKAAVD